MTAASRRKVLSGLNWLYRPLVITLLTAMLTGLFRFVPELVDVLKNRSFDTIEDKVNTKNHIDNALTPEQIIMLSGHVGDPDFHMSKEAKDNNYVTRPEYEELIGRNATTNYQTKEAIEEVLKEIKNIKWDVDIIRKKQEE